MAWLAADIQTTPALHPQEFYNKPLPGLFQLLSHSGCPRSSWLLGLLPFHKGNGLRAGEGRSQALSCPQAGRQGRVGTRDSPVPQNRKDQDPCFTADPHTLTSLSGSLACREPLPGPGCCLSFLPVLQVSLGATHCTISFNRARPGLNPIIECRTNRSC